MPLLETGIVDWSATRTSAWRVRRLLLLLILAVVGCHCPSHALHMLLRTSAATARGGVSACCRAAAEVLARLLLSAKGCARVRLVRRRWASAVHSDGRDVERPIATGVDGWWGSRRRMLLLLLQLLLLKKVMLKVVVVVVVQMRLPLWQSRSDGSNKAIARHDGFAVLFLDVR